ncbi:hypothetical protein [Embleya sp. NPDC020630]|uniref:hypothetical protein n=1 Tax=Embleya sp. NPDC020630 TaxID=3363979 RepID=UPI0037BC96AF
MVASLAILLEGTVQPSSADVRPGTVSWITTHIITLQSTGQDGRQIYYDTIDEIRRVAGHPVAGSLRETQTYNGGLIALDIRNVTNQRVGVLLINPHSLYIAGFMARDNVVYYFLDANPVAISEMQNFASSIGGRAVEAAITGSYADWNREIELTGGSPQEAYDASDFLHEAGRLYDIIPYEENPRFRRIVADAMNALSAAYSEGVRYTSWRDRAGNAMALPFDGNEARIYTPQTRELQTSTVSFSHYLYEWREILRNSNPDYVLPRPFRFGPQNGTVETRREIERYARLYVSGITK